MIIILHIAIALISIALTTYTYFRPSALSLRAGYALVGLTVASGTYLTVASPSHMIETCTVGLAYLGIVSIGIIAARTRLAALKSHA
jgi:hypothetical protein